MILPWAHVWRAVGYGSTCQFCGVHVKEPRGMFSAYLREPAAPVCESCLKDLASMAPDPGVVEDAGRGTTLREGAADDEALGLPWRCLL